MLSPVELQPRESVRLCLYRTGKKRSAGCAEILRYMKKTGVIRFFSLVVEPDNKTKLFISYYLIFIPIFKESGDG